LAYASSPAGKVETTGTVGGDGTGQVKTLKAGSNVTLTSSGTEVTIAATSGGGGGGTLDDAYDYGGAGAGRTITADNGAVQITTSLNPALTLTVSGGGHNYFEVDDGANGKLILQSDDTLALAGPPHSSLENAGKIPDTSAVDLQFSTSGPALSAKGVNSGLFAGNDNTVGAAALFPGGVFAGQAVIAGGNQNTISSDQFGQTSDNAAIVGGDTNEVSVDPALTGIKGGQTKPTDESGIFVGLTNTLKNAENSVIVGANSGNLDTALTSAIFSGTSNSISVANAVPGPPSADVGRNNVILGGKDNDITITMAIPYNPADEAGTGFGMSNVILGGSSNSITGAPRSCVIMGDNAVATTNDKAVFYVAGTDAGGATLNSIALVGSASSGGGAAGNGYADVAFNGGGADFAEMFEWNDGNPNGDDRVGYFVKLSVNADGLPNGKIEISGTDSIGPISSMPGSVVNAAGMAWQGMFLRDDYGRYELDADGNRIVNPNYDTTQDYTMRSARPEWDAVGLKGRVRVRASSNIGIYPSSKSGLTVDVASDGTVIDAGSKGKYKVIQVVRQKEVWSGPEGVFRRRRMIRDHGHGVVEILVE